MVMKMNKKILNIVEFVAKFLVIIIFVILIFHKFSSSNLKKKNTVEIGPNIYSKDPKNVYNSEYKVDGLTFREISYLYDFNTGSTFSIRIINNNDRIYSLHGFTANIYDKKNNLLKKIDIDLRADIGSGDSINYSFDIEGDVIGTQAYKVVYKPN